MIALCRCREDTGTVKPYGKKKGRCDPLVDLYTRSRLSGKFPRYFTLYRGFACNVQQRIFLQQLVAKISLHPSCVAR